MGRLSRLPWTAPSGWPMPRAFFLATSFLTVVPTPISFPLDPVAFSRAVGYFPVVGALLGLGVAALDSGLRLAFPPALAGVFDLAALALVTGGLHLDALIDSCDGLFGGKSVEERLAILRDSRAGSFGVVGAVLVLLTEAFALGLLSGPRRLVALVLALTLARWTMALAIDHFPYARPDGLGVAFKAHLTWREFALAGVVAVAVSAGLDRLEGVAMFVLASALALGLGHFIRSKLGGLTGDSYGAIGQIVEATVLVAFARVF
jgi:adenosylcobinamide-GDP ribazoletransferase